MEPREAEMKNEDKLDLFNLPLLWHDEFDRVWKSEEDHHWPLSGSRPSFHNKDHLEAVEAAIRAYFAGSNEENDPLNLRSDLKRWCEQFGEEVTFAQLQEIMVLVARYHDVGNIMKEVRVEDGQFKPIFFDKYTAKDAEERSQEIISFILDNSNMDPNQKAKYKKLAVYLLGETTYSLTDKDKPFAIAMRFFDQIGNGLFSRVAKDEMILGLLAEMMGENPDVQINPHFFWNFVRARPAELEIDDNTLDKILIVLGKNLPEEDTRFPNQLMPATDFLRKFFKKTPI